MLEMGWLIGEEPRQARARKFQGSAYLIRNAKSCRFRQVASIIQRLDTRIVGDLRIYGVFEWIS
jgi:hypothetical protein